MACSLSIGGLKPFQVGNYCVKAMGHGRTEVYGAKDMLYNGLSQPSFAVAFKLVHAQSPPETSEHTAKIR